MAKYTKKSKKTAKSKARRKFHESDANLRRFIAAYRGEE